MPKFEDAMLEDQPLKGCRKIESIRFLRLKLDG